MVLEWFVVRSEMVRGSHWLVFACCLHVFNRFCLFLHALCMFLTAVCDVQFLIVRV